MALRQGKKIVQVTLKEETIKKLDIIADNELLSRSAIAGKIIEENINKYIPENKENT